MTAVVIIEAVVILLLVILVAGLLKSHAEILRQLHALGARETETRVDIEVRNRTTGFEKAPSTVITGTNMAGAARSVSLDHGRGNTLLAFLSSGCASCQTFWSELRDGVEMPTADTRPLVVTKGPAAESPSRIAELAPSNMEVIMSDEAWDEFRVPLTPYFLLLDGQANVIGEGSAPNWGHLMGLFRQSADDQLSPVHLDTEEREHFTDTELGKAGIEPGDTSLYENPVEK